MASGVKIICVYKTGGWCSVEDVLNLREQLRKNVTDDYEFVCYSDNPSIADVSLECGYGGWWSKIEIFKETGPCIFIDLDTAIFCDMGELISKICDKDRIFLMLKPFYLRSGRRGQRKQASVKNKKNKRVNKFASGIMAWNGDFSYVRNNFNISMIKFFKGDQDYIQKELLNAGEEIGYVDNFLKNIKSYRWHCRKSIPNNISICCFHGNPRPKQVGMPFWGHHKLLTKST